MIINYINNVVFKYYLLLQLHGSDDTQGFPLSLMGIFAYAIAILIEYSMLHKLRCCLC